MGPDSDLDVLVVMPDGIHRRDTATVVYRCLRRFPYPKDIVVATVGDLALYGLKFHMSFMDRRSGGLGLK